MGTYPLETIIREWSRGNLTKEQAIGQILLLVQKLQKRVREVEARLLRLEQANRS